MFNLQGSEIIVILLLALVVLGPEKLPDAIKRFTRTYAELKKMGSGFQSELKSALDEPMREMRETADKVREAADPNRFTNPDVAVDEPAKEPAVEPDAHGEMPAEEQPAEPEPVAEAETPPEPEMPIEPGSSTVSVPGDAPRGDPRPPVETGPEAAHDRDETASA